MGLGLLFGELKVRSDQELLTTTQDRLHADSIVATVSPYATPYARLATGLLNSPEEVDTVLTSVAALGRGG